MTLDSQTTALLVGTLCSAGIAVNLGFTGVAAAAFEVITSRGQADVVASRLHFPYRLVERFTKERWVATLLGISVVFIISAVLDLTCAEWGWPGLSASVGAAVAGLLLTGAVWIYLVGTAALMTPSEASNIHDGIVRNMMGRSGTKQEKSQRGGRKHRDS